MLALFLVDSCFFKNVDYVDTRKYQENLREIKFPQCMSLEFLVQFFSREGEN